MIVWRYFYITRKGKKFKDCKEEFRAKVINENIEGKKSTRYLSREYGIPKGTVDTWIYQY